MVKMIVVGLLDFFMYLLLNEESLTQWRHATDELFGLT